jgi:hypothetical protein
LEGKLKTKIVILITVFSCIAVFNIVAQNSSGNRYLFQENFAKNDVYRVAKDYWGNDVKNDRDDKFWNYDIVNIGFSTGKRIIYDGTVALLDYKLPESALAVLDKDELRLLRNSIYAKYGMIFQSADLKAHFQKFKWYKSRKNNVESSLTEVDKDNIRRIQMFENARPNLNLKKSDLIREYIEYFPVPSWTPAIMINANNTIGGHRGVEDNWEGTYTLENGFLVVLVTKQGVGSSSYFLNSNWRWPNGAVYKDGTITYKTPIRMVFPVGDAVSIQTGGYDLERRQIGSIL